MHQSQVHAEDGNQSQLLDEDIILQGQYEGSSLQKTAKASSKKVGSSVQANSSLLSSWLIQCDINCAHAGINTINGESKIAFFYSTLLQMNQ